MERGDNRSLGNSWVSIEACKAYVEGLILLGENQIREAIVLFQRAVDIEPRFTDAHYSLGVSYHTLENFQRAIQEYEIVLQQRPEDVDALNNLGMILLEQGKLEEAKKKFDRALEIDPNFALTHRSLFFYYQKKREFFKMNKHLKKLLAKDCKALKGDFLPG
jgi:Tfp pilus assembly protein PilF